MFTYILYVVTAGLLLLSFIKDKSKTKKALKKAWKSFENILPQFLAVLIIVGITLAVLDADTISKLIGTQSGIFGMAVSAIIGSISLIPGFVAFPLVAALLKAGAGYGQITMFLSTLMMVGIVSIPVEVQYFGAKTVAKRNVLSFLFAVGISFVIGGIIG